MPEHQTIEWKESWHDEFLEWICGYANAYGGTLYIGRNYCGQVSFSHQLSWEIFLSFRQYNENDNGKSTG